MDFTLPFISSDLSIAFAEDNMKMNGERLSTQRWQTTKEICYINLFQECVLGTIITAGQVNVMMILRRTVCAVKASIPFAHLQKPRVNVTTPLTNCMPYIK